MIDIADLQKKAALVRKWSLLSTTEAGSGHPTSCMSAADLCTVLFDRYFAYTVTKPEYANNDRIVFSKGHAAPLLYTLFSLSGAFPKEELLTLRKFGSMLDGHPTPHFPYARIATGSLGQGLSIGAGIAMTAKKDALPFKTYVLLGDGEMAEGSVWEAANFASYYHLDNLIAIADVNRFGQSQETMFGHNIDEYIQRFSAANWEVLAIDGHDLQEVDKAFSLATKNNSGKPFVIIAKTKKGKGVSFLEDKDGWHGKPVKKEDVEEAIAELGDIDETATFDLKKPESKKPTTLQQQPAVLPTYELGDEIATREVYGNVLAQLGNENTSIYALDADVKNSTFSIDFMKAHPDRFVECFIAEQNMVGVASGFSDRGKRPFVSTFAAFLTRAFDQVRMAALSDATITFVGSHAGVSIGEDGSSQMGLEDMAMFGIFPNSVVLHPADAVATTKLLAVLAKHNGIAYLRTLRPKTPVIYNNDETFVIGGSKVLRASKKDILTVVGAGISLFEIIKAYDLLQKEGIFIRVVDCYSVKPVDTVTLQKCLKETKQKTLITVEDHFIHGGLGDFVHSAVAKEGAVVEKMGVNQFARSGVKDELLHLVGIDAASIVDKVKEYLS